MAYRENLIAIGKMRLKFVGQFDALQEIANEISGLSVGVEPADRI